MKISDPLTPETSAWKKVKTFFHTLYTWTLRYPAALLGAVGVLVVASVLMATGRKDTFDVGGVIGKMFGKKPKQDRIVVANTTPKKRDTPLGVPDDKGIVQRQVEVLETSKNPFRDRSKIHVKTSEGTIPLQLPDGVKDKDVDQVISINSGAFKVEVAQRPKGRIQADDLNYLE
jgi:hypothetical protein